MSVSALLKSFSRVTREKNRRKPVGHVAMLTEQFEVRQLLSAVTILGSDIPRAPAGGTTGSGPAGSTVALTNLPLLNSRPGAPVSVILKMDGYTDDDPGWIAFRNRGSGPIVTPAFDLDGDPLTFNNEELRQIEEIWYRVAEDFSPLNINVTTIAPPVLNNFEHVMVVIGGSNDWAPAAGGWGVVDGFSTGGANTNYVFSGLFFNPHQIASAASHESGHTFGLRHQSLYDADGNKTEEYNPGDAASAPIMGVGYGTTRDTWWNGTSSTSATVIQDDLAHLTRAANQTVQYRTDDFGNTIANAFQVPLAGPTFSINGVLERNGDVDMFRIETNTGPVSFSVNGLDLRQIYGLPGITPGTNADLVLRLYDANGALIAENDPANSLSASLSASVTAGTYFVAVTHTTQYGSIGQYTLSGTVIPLPSTPTMIAPTGILSNSVPTFQWTIGANAASYDLQVDNLTTGRAAFYTANVTAVTHTPPSQFAEGNYRARVRTVASDGTFSNWSNFVAFTIDIPTPATPVITRPQGDIANSFPTFEWTVSQDAANYTLWVTRLDNLERVIFRTNFAGTTYTHFDPLPDATYRAWVRAFNTVGEFSAWSNFVEFTVDAPIPIAPTLTAPARITTGPNPRFVWTPVEGAARYDLWVNNLSTGKAQYLRKEDISRTATFYDPPAMAQGSYVAWIRAANGNNEYSPWSAGYSFTVDILPPATTRLTGPLGPNGITTIESVTPTFTWEAAQRAVRYDLWVNNLTTGKAQIIRRDDIRTTSFTPTTSLPQGVYRAWVRGINSADEVGDWSPTFVFTLDEPTPVVPQVIGPAANLAGVVETANPTFVWTSATKSPLYELEVNNISLNQAKVISVKGIAEEKYTVPFNQRLGEYTYTARVRAYNNSGEVSDWSQPFRFRIDVPAPTTPVIIGPTGTSGNRTPQFSWVHTATSVSYEILVTDLVRNESIVLQVRVFQLNPEGTQAYYNLPSSMALRPSTYRFWIRSFNALGQRSNWSNSQSFVISAQLDPNLFDSSPVENELLLASLLRPISGTTRVSPASVVSAPESTAYETDLPEQYSQSSHDERSALETQHRQDVTLIDVAMGIMADPSSQFSPDDTVS